MMSPSARKRLTNFFVHPRLDLDDARQRRLRDDHVVQNAVVHQLLAGALDGGREHQAAVDGVVAREHEFERGEHVLDGEVREVAERAEVDAEDGRLGVADHARRADHRPVAAEDDDEVGAAHQLLVRERIDRASCLGLDALALEARAAHDRDVAPGAPLHEAADGLERLWLVRLDEHADASDCELLHTCRRWSAAQTRRPRLWL